MKIENCQITSADFEIAHSALTISIGLSGDGWGCGFGGYALDTVPLKPEAKYERRGTAYGTECILRIMRVFEVEKWSAIRGMHCRAVTEGIGGRVMTIGHIFKDKWFSFEDLAKEFEASGALK